MKGCILDILFHFIKMNYYGKMNGHGEVYGQSRSKEFDRAVKYIKEKCKSLPPPSVGIVCGSGLNEIGAKVKEKITIPYSEIPDFPQATVSGHKKELICGKLGGKVVVCMLGRFHLYEGHSPSKVIFPVHVLKLLGIDILLLTNAAGSLNKTYSVGDLVLIKDHISLPSMTGCNPLIGPNDDSFGPRFPCMHDAYDKDLRLLLHQCAEEMKIQSKLREGVYCMIVGPTFATPAEMKLLLSLGGDVVGMSTTPEVIAAQHCGMRVMALSLVTDDGILEVDTDQTVSHADVLAAARENAGVIEALVTKFLQKLLV